MIFRWFSKPRDSKPAIPTVKFDPSRVTDAVKADLWETILTFEDLPNDKESAIFDAAVVSVSRGRDLHVLAQALMNMGVAAGRAAFISGYLNNRASAIMNVERFLSLGVTHAKWLYSGAPCFERGPTSQADIRQDEGHKRASGKTYAIAKGMPINGEWVHPGTKPGCKCVAQPIIEGFD